MLPRSSRLALAASRSSSSSSSSSTSSLLRIASASRTVTRSEVRTCPPPSRSHRSFSSRSTLLSSRRSWENPVSKESEQASQEDHAEPTEEGEGEAGSVDAAHEQDDGGQPANPSASKKPAEAEIEQDDSASRLDETELSAEERAKHLPDGYFTKNGSVEKGDERTPSSASTDPSNEAATSSPPSQTDKPIDTNLPPTPPPNASTKSSSKSSGRSKAPSTSASRLAAVLNPTPASPKQLKSSTIATPEREATKQEMADETAQLVEMDEVLILPAGMLSLPPFKKNFNVRNPDVVAAIRGLIAQKTPYLGIFLLKGEDADTIATTDDIHLTGLLCKIDTFVPVDQKNLGGRWTLTIEPKHRIRMDEVVQTGTEVEKAKAAEPASETAEPPAEEGAEGEVTSFEQVDDGSAAPLESLRNHAVSIGKVSHFPSVYGPITDEETKLQFHAAWNLFSTLTGNSSSHHESLLRVRTTVPSLANLNENQLDLTVDMMAAICENSTPEELQTVVDAVDLQSRLIAVIELLKKDKETIDLKARIFMNSRASLEQRQKEVILHEQMRAIKKELGTDGASQKEDVITKFKDAAAKLNMPEEARKVFDSEINKLATMESSGSEYSVLRNYIEWITSIPWGIHTVDSFSIPSSTTILDADHYGLQTVKDRILEFLAVGKLRGTVQGKIICFVGPPGVGKTSIAKSIARALERKFYRISVGGLRDVAEIKGHRRTYVGALPGKPIQALKLTGSENPVILIDEIDKVSGGGGGWGGDPLSALLELLDPEQNSSFSDHYLDIPVDLSKVLFVCTANTLSTIPAPLLDRMEVIEISGYVSAEKRVIASRYLSPQAKKASGLETADVTIEDSAVDELIQFYCRESGVRNLKKKIDQIYRKAAYNIVTDVEGKTSPAVEEGAAKHQAVEVLPGIPEPSLNQLGEVPPPAVSDESRSAPSSSSSSTPPTSASSSSDPKTPLEFPKSLFDLHGPGDSAPLPAAPTASSDSKTLPSGSTTVQAIKPMDIPAGVSLRVTSANLKDYVGPAPYQKDRIYSSDPPPGVSNGLGYTGNGAGALMPIEVSVMPGKGAIQTTGKLGEVINESIKIAVSYLRTNAFALGITSQEKDIILGGSSDQDIHLHMPEGSIGKDGPSAGTAILVALVSLLTKTRVDPDIAMTGEITLNGQVLPVGGLKEKILAAHRASIKKLIVPLGVRSDIEANVPDSVKEGIKIVYVSNVREVLYEVFGTLPVADRWKEKYPLDLLDLYRLPGTGEGASRVEA